MPPRYAYWTILIDKGPTAFRARVKDDLLPTLNQLRRTNTDVELKWFARGRLWDSPEQERLAPRMPRVKRTRDWRPGGTHTDPRQRFKTRGDRRERPPKDSQGDRPPWKDRGHRPPGIGRPDRPPEQGRGDRPPEKDRGTRPAWKNRGDRPAGKGRGPRR